MSKKWATRRQASSLRGVAEHLKVIQGAIEQEAVKVAAQAKEMAAQAVKEAANRGR